MGRSGSRCLSACILNHMVVVRWKWVREMVKSEPTLLVRNGVCLATRCRAQRITREEIDAAVRQYGLVTVEEAACVMLETDGS